MSQRSSVPEWFPFALIGSGIIAVAAGMRSNWKLGREIAAPAPSPPPSTPAVAQAGVLHEGGWI